MPPRYAQPPRWPADGKRQSFGLIHEFRQKAVLVTLAAFLTSDCSLYFGTGRRDHRGDPGDQTRRDRPQDDSAARRHRHPLERSDEFEPPAPGELSFIILTTEGRFRSKLTAMPTYDPPDPNYQLLALSQGLGGEMRKVSEAKSG